MKTKKVNREKAEIIQDVADTVGGEVRIFYSGRGEHGDTCMGVVCADPHVTVKVAAELGLWGAKVEKMGSRYIVYWTRVKWKLQARTGRVIATKT